MEIFNFAIHLTNFRAVGVRFLVILAHFSEILSIKIKENPKNLKIFLENAQSFNSKPKNLELHPLTPTISTIFSFFQWSLFLLGVDQALCSDSKSSETQSSWWNIFANFEAADWAYYVIVGYCLLMFLIVLVYWVSPQKADPEDKKKE